MELKKGYKQTDIGIIPSDWAVKRLGELFEITSSKRVFQKDWKANGIPFYRARELAILGEKGYVDNELYITNEMYDSYKKQYGVPLYGDMLVTGVGTLGKVYVISNDHKFYFKDGNIIWFKILGKVNPDFLKQLYSTRLIIKQIEDASAGTTVGTYTISGAKKTSIPIPPAVEQTTIANSLSDADALITSLEKLIEKKQVIKQGVMQQLLTGKKRLAGYAGAWIEKSFPEMCWFQEGPGLRNWQFTSNGIKVINVTNLEDGYLNLDRTTRYISWVEFEKMYKHFEVDANDIVVASSGNSYAKVAVVRKQDLPLVMNTSVIRFKPLKNTDYYFLLAFLKSNYFKDQIDLLITGGAQPNFGPFHLKKIIIKVPPTKDEQIHIAHILTDMDSEIEGLEQKLSKYKLLKQGMMQELLTGKIRFI